jgi:predicted TIM-barrel fold metal-dependent hydrolase
MAAEAILEPDLPIIDPHHHLWDRPPRLAAGMPENPHPFLKVIAKRPRYLLDELLADTQSGHKVIGTVFLQCGAFYRADGPEPMRVIGETEFVNGVAAMTASGQYGDIRACAGIVGHADLTLGSAVRAVLEAQAAHAPERWRGIRHSCSYDADPAVLGPLAGGSPGLYLDPRFREGFAEVGRLGMTFDAWLLEPQLPDLIDLARAFPDQPIVLDHVGTPLGLGVYEGKMHERFGVWRDNIRELARSPLVTCKLGGLAMAFPNFPSFLSDPPAPSTQLAEEWRPYIETCIEAFGPDRCMFESNFPVDFGACTYDVLWNAFKRLASGYSDSEKADLFAGTARRFYRLTI